MILLDQKDIEKLKRRLKRGGAEASKPKRMTQPKLGAAAERLLKRRIDSLWKDVIHPASEKIRKLIAAGAPAQEIADEMSRVFAEASQAYGVKSKDIVWQWQMSVDNETRRSMGAALSKTLGVDVKAIVDDPIIADALAIGSHEAASLITSIPQEYLGDVSAAVMRNVRGEKQPKGRSLLEQIDHIGNVGQERARLIARDQTNKMIGVLMQTRQQDAGIDEYTWRTVRDNRVVGKPGGKYPKGNDKHMDHYSRDGKVFRWDSPPPDGHPASGILCRCWAAPVIDVAKILEKAKAW